MAMRRKDWAWLMTLVLVVELVLFACACVQVDHHCPADAPCVICEYLHTLSRVAFPLLLVLGLLTARTGLATACDARQYPRGVGSLISKKVRMND